MGTKSLTQWVFSLSLFWLLGENATGVTPSVSTSDNPIGRPWAIVLPKYQAIDSPYSTGASMLMVMTSGFGSNCGNADRLVNTLGTTLDLIGKEITVSNAFSLPILTNLECYFPYSVDLGRLGTFGQLSPGHYSVRMRPWPGLVTSDPDPRLNDHFISTSVLTRTQAARSNIEVPAEGSVQSGIGLMSGWACVAEDIEVSIDGGSRTKVPAESPRKDVEAVCGHTNAGFGLLMNYNTLGEGDHTFQLYIRGISTGGLRRFKVVRTKGEFATGLSKEVTVNDFPEVGKRTVLEWREGEQRFAIKAVQ